MNEIITSEISIEDMIYEIRGKQVMLDQDVAFLFEYETKNLNRQVKRNIERFTEEYCFKISKEEYTNLRCQKVTSSLNYNYGGRRYMPYVFTEYGITMLAGILKSTKAIKMSLKIVNTFISMRKYISNNLIEQKNINNLVLTHENNFKEVYKDIRLLQESFDKLEKKKKINEIYFNGQIYDAYSKIIDIFMNAQKELIIIDSYADNTTLNIIKKLNIKVIIITKENNLLTSLDISEYNKQYHNTTVIYNNTYHNRYFILDKSIIYHCGSSINRIGYKTFSITLLQDKDICNILINNINTVIEKHC